MARLNTFGNANALAHVTAAALAGGSVYRYSPEDADAHIESMPGGGLTLVLPGPNAQPAFPPPQAPIPAPNDGDFYEWHDPLGLIGNVNTLTLDGGGFNFGAPGQPATLTYGAAFTNLGGRFVFNAKLQLWVGCGCNVFFQGQ